LFCDINEMPELRYKAVYFFIWHDGLNTEFWDVFYHLSHNSFTHIRTSFPGQITVAISIYFPSNIEICCSKYTSMWCIILWLIWSSFNGLVKWEIVTPLPSNRYPTMLQTSKLEFESHCDLYVWVWESTFCHMSWM